jgi:hypothetical protein
MAKVGEKIVKNADGKEVSVPLLEVRKAATLYIDKKGRVYENPLDNDPVDHYKIDNFSLVAYHHQLTPKAAEGPKVKVPPATLVRQAVSEEPTRVMKEAARETVKRVRPPVSDNSGEGKGSSPPRKSRVLEQ